MSLRLPKIFATIASRIFSATSWGKAPRDDFTVNPYGLSTHNAPVSHRSIRDTVPDLIGINHSPYARKQRQRALRRRTYSKLIAGYRHPVKELVQ